MQLYSSVLPTLSLLKEVPFILERNLQNLFESNLSLLTGLQLVKSEFKIKNYRIDTLAFDPETKSFVIIEYKRDKNASVVDQGMSYLNLMLEYKGDFFVEYNETQSAQLRRNDIDWSQSRVVFIASSFNDNQKQATNFKDLSIELIEVKQYEGGFILVNPITKSKAAPSIKPIQQNSETYQKVAAEIHTYIEEDHLHNKPDEVKDLYEVFRNAIINLTDDVIITPNKQYISFKKGKKIIADIAIQTQELKLYINIQGVKFSDPRNIGKLMNDKTKWGSGYYQLIIKNTDNLEYIMSLIKQAIN